MRDLARFLAPRAIAAIGGGWAANVVEQCRRMGFAGPLWPVNPQRREVAGIPCLPSLDALPGVPDAVFVGVNRHATVGVVRALAAMGAGGASLFASGWEEAGELALQRELLAAAGDMPILGPNAYGFINYLDGAPLWPDQHGGRRVGRGVAILSQSSNIAINLTMQARGLPIAYVACIGNATRLGFAELGGALLADPRVSALGLHVEGVGDARDFAALAEAAAAAGKRIVAVKTGRTSAAQAAAASHTAALAGGAAASRAFLAACGVAEVATPAALVEALKLAHFAGPRVGPRLAAACCSGGEAGLVADLAAAAGIDLPPLAAAQLARLGALLGPRVALANPLDYHTYIWGDGPRTAAVFTTLLADADAGLFVIDPPRADRCDPAGYRPALDAVAAAAAATGRPALMVSSLPENMGEALAEAMAGPNLVPMMGIETALAAVAAMQAPPGRPGWRPWAPVAAGSAGPAGSAGERLVDEAAAKPRLAAAGVAVPRGVAAATLAGLDAGALRPPLALKGLGIAHKSEAGAVRLNLATLAGQAGMAGATGYLAEEMVAGGIAELLVGLRRDPVYGATLTLGAGGVAAELLADTVTLILPVEAGQVAAALRRLRLWPLLDGYRGRPRADAGAAVAVAMRLQAMMAADDTLAGIEINPLILCREGAVAADAVIWESTR